MQFILFRSSMGTLLGCARDLHYSRVQAEHSQFHASIAFSSMITTQLI
jgi:hypothetical protein